MDCRIQEQPRLGLLSWLHGQGWPADSEMLRVGGPEASSFGSRLLTLNVLGCLASFMR